MNDVASMVDVAEAVAKAAGKTILKFYRKDIAFKLKSDGSPVTLADQASHQSIMGLLSKTKIPIVSEEAKELSPGATRYWLVDPLDGTKDFLAGNDEFTVNIALIENGTPILGVLFAPALDELYVGVPGGPAWQERHGVRTHCGVTPKSKQLKMAVSNFHDHPDSEVFAQANQVAVSIPIGSALKYGRLAAGEVDVYPRLVGTSEWDTAAGQAVLVAAGGRIVDWNTGRPLLYGKPRRRNGRFIAFRAPYTESDFLVTKTIGAEP